MRIYYINLERCPDRQREFLRVNGHLLDLLRFPAIDGQRLDIATLVRCGLVTEDILENYNLGAVGCALSHTALWELAARGDEPLTLCEDDTIFNRHFEVCAEQVIQSLRDDWDIILWGWNFDLYLCFEMMPGVSYALAQFEQDRMRETTELFQSQIPSSRAFKLLWCFGTPGYTVSAKGARVLRDRLLPFRPMTAHFPDGERVSPGYADFSVFGVDLALNSIYRELNAFVCFPPLLVTRNEEMRSTVQINE
jgi:GR25 family glycosyltransferase involved in LPS biosynthesis